MPCRSEEKVIQCNEGRFKDDRMVTTFQATLAHFREGTNSILVLSFWKKLPSKEQQLSRTQHLILSLHAAMFGLHTIRPMQNCADPYDTTSELSPVNKSSVRVLLLMKAGRSTNIGGESGLTMQRHKY